MKMNLIPGRSSFESTLSSLEGYSFGRVSKGSESLPKLFLDGKDDRSLNGESEVPEVEM